MTDLLDIAPTTGIVLRDTDGTVVLDTNQRMPHVLGSVSFAGSISLPKISGEVRVSRLTLGGTEYRWLVPEHNGRVTLDMGAWSAPAFNFFFGRVQVLRDAGTWPGHSGGAVNWHLPVVPFTWSGGSLAIHSLYAGTAGSPTHWYWRYMIPEVEAGRLVMAFYRVNRDNTPGWADTELNTSNGTAIDLDIEFDATFCAVDL